MNQNQLLRNLGNFAEKHSNQSPYLELAEYFLWFFEIETRDEGFQYNQEIFAKQIMFAISLLRTSNLDDVVKHRDNFLANSVGVGITEIPNLIDISHDNQKETFELILKVVVCELFPGFELTYWPAIVSLIHSAEDQLSNAIVLFMATVWENGFWFMATEKPEQKVIKVGDIPITVIIADGQISLTLCDGRLQIFFVENEIYTIPGIAYHDIKLLEVLSVINRTIDTWFASQSDHSLVQTII